MKNTFKGSRSSFISKRHLLGFPRAELGALSPRQRRKFVRLGRPAAQAVCVDGDAIVVNTELLPR